MFILKGIKNFLSDLYHIALQSFVLLYTWALLNISFTLSVQLLFYLAFHVLPVVSRGLGSVFSQPIFQLLFRWTPASFFWFHTFFIFGFIIYIRKKAASSDVHHLSARYHCLWHLYFTPAHTYAPWTSNKRHNNKSLTIWRSARLSGIYYFSNPYARLFNSFCINASATIPNPTKHKIKYITPLLLDGMPLSVFALSIFSPCL